MPPAWYLASLVVAALMAVAAAVGLLADGLYRDNPLVRAGWLGNDVVTLCLVPVLVWAAVLARRGSPRALLVCLGLLAYALYGYAFYTFGAAFNALFLAYVAILALAMLGLLAGLTVPEVQWLAARVRVGRRERAVAVVVVVVTVLLGAFWVASSLAFVRTGQVPAMVSAVGHPTNVTAALDLWLVSSFGLLGGAWLWRGRGWGVVVCALWTVQGAAYMAALSAATVSALAAGATTDVAPLLLWLTVGLACAAGAGMLLAACPEAAPRSESA